LTSKQVLKLLALTGSFSLRIGCLSWQFFLLSNGVNYFRERVLCQPKVHAKYILDMPSTAQNRFLVTINNGAMS